MSRYKRNKVQTDTTQGPGLVYMYTESGERALKSWYDEMIEKYHYTRDEMEEFLQIKCREDYLAFLSEKITFKTHEIRESISALG